MRTFLVTGGAGFIGSHIAEALVQRGDRVRVLDNLSTGNLANLASFRNRIELIEGDVVDTATVYATMGTLGLYGAGAVAYLTAASANWLFNRLWTFRHIVSTDSWHVQWRRFLAANLTGFVINRGVYALLVTFVDLAARQPVIAVFAGALAGMTLNFNLSRKMVFR